MSHPRKGDSPGRALTALAKRYAELAIDLRAALADAEGRGWADGLVALGRRVASEVEEAGVDVRLGRRELGPAGPELPILAAIEKKTHSTPANGFHEAAERSRAVREDLAIAADWRSARVEGIETRLHRLLRDSGVETAGQAWDALESGTLSPHFWTHAEAKRLEGAIAAMRERAGDPAPFVEVMPPAAPVREVVIADGRIGPAGATEPGPPARDDGRGLFVALNPFKQVKRVIRARSIEDARVALAGDPSAGALTVVAFDPAAHSIPPGVPELAAGPVDEDREGDGPDDEGPAKYFLVSPKKGNPLYCLTAASVEEAVEYVERDLGRDWDGRVREVTPAEWVRLPSWLTTRPADAPPEEPAAPPAHVLPPDFDFCSLHPPARPKPETPPKYVDVGNLPKPKPKRKSDRSFDLVTKGGAWVARIWAEDSGAAWGLANTAFPAFYEKPSGFDIRPASARYAQEVINAGGKRLRDVAWESGPDSGRERFHMASSDDVGIPSGAPSPGGRTLEEQGHAPGVGAAADPSTLAEPRHVG